MAALNAAEVRCGVLMAPILPGISDHPRQLREVARAAIEAGATFVSPTLLHLRPAVREEFLPWLRHNYPELVPRYEDTYARSYAPDSERRALGRRVHGIVRALDGIRPAAEPPERWRRDEGRSVVDRPHQLTLV